MALQFGKIKSAFKKKIETMYRFRKSVMRLMNISDAEDWRQQHRL